MGHWQSMKNFKVFIGKNTCRFIAKYIKHLVIGWNDNNNEINGNNSDNIDKYSIRKLRI